MGTSSIPTDSRYPTIERIASFCDKKPGTSGYAHEFPVQRIPTYHTRIAALHTNRYFGRNKGIRVFLKKKFRDSRGGK